MSTTTWIALIIGGIFVLGLLVSLVSGVWKKLPANMDSMKSYLQGQFMVLSAFLVLAFLLASAFIYFGPIRSERPQRNGVILDPRRVTLDKDHPVYTKQFGDLTGYARVTILAHTTAPPPTPTPTPPAESAGGSPEPAGTPADSAGGTAVVTVHRTLNEGRGDEIRRLVSSGETWTRWEEDNPKGDMSLIVEGNPLPVVVELIIYVTPKK